MLNPYIPKELLTFLTELIKAEKLPMKVCLFINIGYFQCFVIFARA